MELSESQKKLFHDFKIQIHCLQPTLTGIWITDLLNASWRILNQMTVYNDYTIYYIKLFGILSEFDTFLEKISLNESLIPLLEQEGILIRKDYQQILEELKTSFKCLQDKISKDEFDIIKYVRDRESHLFTQGYIVSATKGKIATDRNGVDRIEFREKIVNELRKFNGGEKGFAFTIVYKTHSNLENLKNQFERLCEGKNYDIYITNPRFLFEA